MTDPIARTATAGGPPPAFADHDGDAHEVDGPRTKGPEARATRLLLLAARHGGGVAPASVSPRENLPRALIKGDMRGIDQGSIA